MAINSINTNFAAQTALQSLNRTNRELNETQNRISTGFRVASASDNAAYFSIATTLRSDNKALSAVQDSLGLGAATVDTAVAGVNAVIEVVDEIKARLVTARGEGVDRTKIQTEITQLQAQLTSIAGSAVLSGGENFLSVDTAAAGFNLTKSVVSAFTRAGSSISIQTIQIDTTSVVLFDANAASALTGGGGILDGLRDGATGARAAAGTFTVATFSISALTNSAADLATLEGFIRGTDNAIGELTGAATTLGAVQSRISIQRDFVSALVDSLDRGTSQLVDADLNQESTRLQALQVKQQLGVQALSIANQNTQAILALFR